MNGIGLRVMYFVAIGILATLISHEANSQTDWGLAKKKKDSASEQYFGAPKTTVLKTTYIPQAPLKATKVSFIQPTILAQNDVVVEIPSQNSYSSNTEDVDSADVQVVPVSLETAASRITQPKAMAIPESKSQATVETKSAKAEEKPAVKTETKSETKAEATAKTSSTSSVSFQPKEPASIVDQPFAPKVSRTQAAVPMPSANFQNSSSSDREQLALLKTSPNEELEPKKTHFESDGDFPVRFHPHLGVAQMYDDNFLTRPTNRVGDFIWMTSPGFTLEFGKEDPDNPNYDRILGAYTASIYTFLDETDNDTVEQDGSFQVRKNFEKLTLFLDQRVRCLEDATLDINARTARDLYDSLVGARYEVSDKTSVEWTAAQLVSNYADDTRYSDKMEWFTDLMLDYKILPKVTIGIGPRIGWMDIAGSANQTYEQALSRILWQPTAKLAFSVIGGWEFRQYQDDVIAERDSGTISVGANWYPFDGTKLGMEIFRGVKNSASISGQNFVSTGFTALARQRFFQELYLEVQGGYQTHDYYRTSGGTFIARNDRYYTIKQGVTWAFAEWGSVGVNYQYRQNDSNQFAQEFVNNIYAIEANFRY
ncbi:MAG: outer membrane beta-barrel protein [Verrucomicrobiota bacterium]